MNDNFKKYLSEKYTIVNQSPIFDYIVVLSETVPQTKDTSNVSEKNRNQLQLKIEEIKEKITNEEEKEKNYLQTLENRIIQSPVDDFWKTFFQIKENKSPIYIENINGQSCFMDTCIHCLFWTPGLLESLKNDADTIDTMNTNTEEEKKQRGLVNFF